MYWIMKEIVDKMEDRRQMKLTSYAWKNINKRLQAQNLIRHAVMMVQY